MKKGWKSCLVVVLALVVGLCIVGGVIAFVAKPCPPRGPWPMPPWCGESSTAFLPGISGIPAVPVLPGQPAPTEAVKQFIPSSVPIYGRVFFDQPQEWIMNGNIWAFGPIVGTNLDWIHKLQSHGAKAFSNISTWNSLMAKTPDELPPDLKNSGPLSVSMASRYTSRRNCS
jgi:hypothetical protein